VRLAFELAQLEHLAVDRLEARKRAPDRRARLAAARHALGRLLVHEVGGRLRLLLAVVDLAEALAPARVAAQPIEPGVDRDPVQPRREGRAALEARQRPTHL